MKYFKYWTTVLLLCTAAFLSGCNEDDNSSAVTGVTLDKPALIMAAGETATLTATISPDNVHNKNVSWKSDNMDVATVEEGIVTAVADGSAKITVTTEDGGFTATCNVTVTSGAAIVVTPDVQAIEFSADGNILYANGEQISTMFTVTSNEGWNVNVESNWCSVTKVGLGFTVSAVANSEPVSPEQATIIVSAGDAEPVTIIVSQRPVSHLAISPEVDTIIFSVDGQQATNNGVNFTPTFTVTTNQDSWSVDFDDTDEWCSVEITGNTFTITATENTSKYQRGRNLTISAGEATPITINILQEGKPAEYDIYLGGHYRDDAANYIAYWFNGEKSTVYSLASWSILIDITSMCVNGSDIYLAGYEKPAGASYNLPSYWKNGMVTNLTSTTATGTQDPLVRAGTVNGIAMHNGKLYAAGDIQQRNLNAAGTSSSTIRVVKLWVDGMDIDISDPLISSNGNCMYIANNKVYIGGYVSNRPTYWVYDIATTEVTAVTVDPDNSGSITAIYVDGNDVYAGGKIGLKAVYWKNGALTTLTEGNGADESVNAIKVLGGTVYAAGTEYIAREVDGNSTATATYWINGKATHVSSTAAKPKSYGYDMSITDQGDVYVAGLDYDDAVSSINSKAGCWKNGEPMVLESSGNIESAKAIVTVEKD